MSNDLETRVAKLESKVKQLEGRAAAYEHVFAVVGIYLDVPGDGTLPSQIREGPERPPRGGELVVEARRRCLKRLGDRVSQARREARERQA